MAVNMSGCEPELCAFQLSPETAPFLTSFASAPSPPAESGDPTLDASPPRRSSPPSSSPPSHSRIATGAVVGTVIGGVVVLLLLTFLFFWLYKKNRNTKKQDADDQNLPPPTGHLDGKFGGQQIHPAEPEKYMLPRHSPPNARTLHSVRNHSSSGSNSSGSEGLIHAPLSFSNMFTFEELHIATDGFSATNFLGEGGFGYVHKGVLKNRTEVAIKSLKLGSMQGEREFQAEVEIISRVHHRHLVSLVGYCISGPQRMLVYDFVPNNTLEFHLHGQKDQATMDWPTRLKIALGSAKGLAYLHEDCHPRIIHRDIKSANILLDYKFQAKVADFGLAKVCSDTYTHVTTRVMGTFGYLAPEYASSGKLTEKSDVYSFGVVLLELITGHRPIGSRDSYMDYSLVEWARPLLSTALKDSNFDSLVDQQLKNKYSLNEMTRMAACAASCVRHSPHHRPQMSMVTRVLEGQVSLIDLDKGMIVEQSPV